MVTRFFKSKRGFSSGKGKFWGVVYGFLFVVTLISLVVSLSDLLSSAITHTGSLFLRENFSVPSYSMYCVSCEKFKNQDDAIRYANNLKDKGGLGEVLRDGEYYAIVSVYPTLLEAKEIEENLKTLGYNANIKPVTAREIKTRERGDLAKLKEFVDLPRETFLRVYNLGLLLDKGKLTKLELDGNLSVLIDKLDKETKDCGSDFSGELKNNLKFARGVLSDLVSFRGSDLEISSAVKLACYKIATNDALFRSKI